MGKVPEGQHTLPGVTERGLRASEASERAARRRRVDYLALSVQRSADGTWQAMSTKLDAASGQVLPELLDTWEVPAEQSLSKEEALLYWAQEVALRAVGGWGVD